MCANIEARFHKYRRRDKILIIFFLFCYKKIFCISFFFSNFIDYEIKRRKISINFLEHMPCKIAKNNRIFILFRNPNVKFLIWEERNSLQKRI